ncbi:hypothetical protein Syun_005035 [Stephania yunnanensis]|uniref:non-specific serine/threonine protein kinase n=1 Tax=Stephania yunnanensis TaxID=152371 RepID=A0AAP0L5J0_9MAGN
MAKSSSSQSRVSSVANQTTAETSQSRSLTQKTPLLGLKLYVLIGICAIGVIATVLLILLCFRYNRKFRKRGLLIKHTSGSISTISREIAEVKPSNRVENAKICAKKVKLENCFDIADAKSVVDVGSSGGSQSSSSNVSVEVASFGWGKWYSMKELESATNGFAAENVVGEGGYGIVYRGVMADRTVVAVKSLLNKKGQAEQEFKVEVEAIGKVRHRNLVGLIGYCTEGVQRMLVYEFVENGNLEQWLHGDVGPVSPLIWDIRMKIAVGIAKGLAYLHEGLEPKVVHRDIKSSNILVDKKWNPKVSDFGLAKLLGSDSSYVTTRVMGTFGCVAPEYASTGMLSACSDVYSFGVLLMEIISGRSPVDYSRPVGEVNLVDWFKGMVASRQGDEVVDPRIGVHPPTRSLKRAILVCLRCTDLDANKRPKMGQVAHMLEGDDFPFRTDSRSALDTTSNSIQTSTSTANRQAFPSNIAGCR